MPFPRSNSRRAPLATPAHVAIIMDGNGRWAQARGLPRFEGHRRGVEAVRRAVRSAIAHDVRYLTIYSFSSENWRRPPDEVAMLMGLLKRFIRNDLAELNQNGVRVRIIGERDNLAPDIAPLLVEAESLTKNNCGLTLTVAFNYGGRQEIVEAARTPGDRRARRSGRRQRDRRRRLRRPARYGGVARSRSDHPDVGRNAAFEFPAVAGRLRRTGFLADLVARFRRRRVCVGAGSICGAGAAFRRGRRTRVVVCRPHEVRPMARERRGRRRPIGARARLGSRIGPDLRPRVAAAVVLGPCGACRRLGRGHRLCGVLVDRLHHRAVGMAKDRSDATA